ncbi:MAG: hypothetical protein Q7U66_11055 [Methylobacter sp.]|nr:hypothetical protein [Methylobacter sp.]
MAAPFMLDRTTMSVFITIMLPTADMVMDLTAITDLGHAFTAGAGEAMVMAEAGEVMAGEDVVGIETEIMHQAYLGITAPTLPATVIWRNVVP